MLLDLLQALVLGFLFGWSLHKAGLTHYARIVNVYRFRDMTVMRFMLSALLTGAVASQIGVDLGFATTLPLTKRDVNSVPTNANAATTSLGLRRPPFEETSRLSTDPSCSSPARRTVQCDAGVGGN